MSVASKLDNGQQQRGATVEFRTPSPSRQRPQDAPASDIEGNTPSTDSSKTATENITTDSEGNTVIPPHSFLAYARRVRSFSSPLKLNKSRYLLTFTDADVAQQWWKLMQQEYPETVRESSQLFSFKSDQVPSKAWENPRFTHLKTKWTYRVLEGNTAVQEKQHNGMRPNKRASLSRMMSTPSLRTIGERQPSPDKSRHDSSMEDPFLVAPTAPARDGVDLLELNRTLDRIMMMMNETNLRINALAQKQQTYAEALDRLQLATEGNATQISSLTTQQQAGAISTRNMRSSIEQNASQLRVVLDTQSNQLSETEAMQRGLQETAGQVELVANTQRASAEDVKTTRSTVERTAEQIQTILDQQRESDAKLDALQSTLEHNAALAKSQASRMQTPVPSAGAVQKLQVAVEAQSAQFTNLFSEQKASGKKQSKSQLIMDQITAEQKGIVERVEHLQGTSDHNAIMAKQHSENLQARMDRRFAKLEQQATITQIANAEQQQAMMKTCQHILDTLETRLCDHDVVPPPRKTNRKVIGFVYEK